MLRCGYVSCSPGNEGCVCFAAAPEMLLLWMYVFGCIGLIWGVTRGAEALRKANEQVLAAAAVHMKGMCIALCISQSCPVNQSVNQSVNWFDCVSD